MPWKEVSVMSERQEFVRLAQAEEFSMRELCRRFGVSPTTGYKWLKRYRGRGDAGLADMSRRPRHSPGRTRPEVEQLVLELREKRPAWGARKLQRRLLDQGYNDLPSPSTITAILRRHGRIDPGEGDKHKPWQRFERVAPNELWQMDFKGHFPLSSEGRCHPLTVLDDHSRYSLGLEACGDERDQTVKGRLTTIFRRYGLPDWMLDGQRCSLGL